MTAIKIDENLYPQAAGVLREQGHDVATVADQNLRGTDDERLIDICHREGRALLTLDAGFADIRRYPPESYSGIIVLRLKSQSGDHVLHVISRLMAPLRDEDPAGRLWVVTEQGIRIHQRED